MRVTAREKENMKQCSQESAVSCHFPRLVAAGSCDLTVNYLTRTTAVIK